MTLKRRRTNTFYDKFVVANLPMRLLVEQAMSELESSPVVKVERNAAVVPVINISRSKELNRLDQDIRYEFVAQDPDEPLPEYVNAACPAGYL